MDEQEQRHTVHRQIRSIVNFVQGIAFTLLLFGLLFAVYLIVVYHTRLTPLINYAVVFDAGSSHTEMFVYHWSADKSDGLGTTSSVDQLDVCSLSSIVASDTVKIGESIKLKAISDFEQHLDRLPDYFRPCLDEAIRQIPAHRHKFSPIFLGATAGMRLAWLRNSTRAALVLEAIRDIFSKSPFQFVIARQVSDVRFFQRAPMFVADRYES